MRCNEFEHHLELVTDGEADDSALHEDVIKHAASCGSCSRRLREEQMLSWSFGEIGAHIGQISPSLEIEPRVMKAFDHERQRARRSDRSWPRYATAAIAATLLMMGTVSFALWRRQPSPARPGRSSSLDLSAAVASVEIGQTARPFEVKSKRARKLNRNAISHDASALASPPEIATDFIRINGAPIEPGDQIVRVQLPRSAMARFGLPVNMDRSDKPVKADVIMGIDGVAQAIRFVQ
jgi:hypothetical protein